MKGIKEHYVPLFYLKNFGERIYFYDKQERKTGQSAPKNICLQRNFYTDASSGLTAELENAVSQLEGRASAVVSRMINTENPAELSDTDKATLCEFVAFQHVRTPEYRAKRRDFTQSFYDATAKIIGVDDWRIVEKEEYSGRHHLVSMLNYVNLVPYICQMNICLLKNETDIPLWTSDNPVVRHNALTDKIGFGCLGVQTYLPLTQKLLLWFYDKIYGDFPDTATMEKANVIHANHLQALFSARFVYSNTSEFYMVEKMLEANDDYMKRYFFDAP